MEAILNRLEKEAWVRGSMIVSNEGMVVVERLSGDLDRDAVAALAGDLVTEVTEGLKEAGHEPFKRFLLSATTGDLVVVDCGTVYLTTAHRAVAACRHRGCRRSPRPRASRAGTRATTAGPRTRSRRLRCTPRS